jgi:hypothetical protein
MKSRMVVLAFAGSAWDQMLWFEPNLSSVQFLVNSPERYVYL